MLFLTELELRELTRLQRPSAIARWLREHGYPFDLAADGWPRVLRAYVEQRLSGDTAPTKKREPALRLV
jgi:hypothetical protein